MRKIGEIILCEGETDQALIGSFLEHVMNLEFFYNKESVLPKENVVWYRSNEFQEIIGIWQVGGCDFTNALSFLLQGQRLDSTIDRIVIVTDNDSDEEVKERMKGIENSFREELGAVDFKYEDVMNRWGKVVYEDSFSDNIVKVLLILVPYNEQGALETFMMNTLSENNIEREAVIRQARKFVEDFKSETYLIKRRDRIKAELGVSLAVFTPDRVFTTMKELIDSVDWEDFDLTDKQFGLLKEVFYAE